MHEEIWAEVARVLKPDGVLVLSMSDHMRKGKQEFVTAWHVDCLRSLGFDLHEWCGFDTPRNRFGANGGLRVEYESLIRFKYAGGQPSVAGPGPGR